MQPTTYLPGANPYSDGWNGRRRKRIDGRSQSDPATQAGMRGIHRDTKGNVIGGYTAEGQGIGTKRGGWRSAPVSATPMAGAGSPVTTVAPPTVQMAPASPNATPLGQKRSWRDGMGTQGTIGTELGNAPTATGGGLWRWHAMNPNAGKFGKERTMDPGEIRDAPAVANQPLGPKLPPTAVPSKPLGPELPKAAATPAAQPVAQKQPKWRQPRV